MKKCWESSWESYYYFNQILQLCPPIIMVIQQNMFQRNNCFYSCGTFNSSHCIADDLFCPKIRVRLYFMAFARPGNNPSFPARGRSDVLLLIWSISGVNQLKKSHGFLIRSSKRFHYLFMLTLRINRLWTAFFGISIYGWKWIMN